MAMKPRGAAVRILDFDPDLAEGLPAEQLIEARELLVAGVVSLRSHRRYRFESEAPESPCFGYLLLEGTLIRELTLGGRTSAELLGPGDLIRPGAAFPPEGARTRETWTALEETRAAVLDRHFIAKIQRYPGILIALMDRLFIRAKTLGFHMTVCSLPRIDQRLMVMFRHLADRRGKVTPAGIRIPLTLRHSTLAALVGARRPATTTALGSLIDRGLIEHFDHGVWMLKGPASNDPQAVLDSMLDHPDVA